MGIPKSRVIRIGKVIHQGSVSKEKRDGDKISNKYSSNRQSVRNLIKSLNCLDSHYERDRSKRISYLPGSFNMSKIV